ncbi:MAG: hypothetical protein ACRDYE_07290 [Acidimicrobiales bacterium]
MPHARDSAYDIILLAHVLSALAGFGVVVVAGASALALRRAAPPSEALRRYYRPGVNWAGRTIFLVPVLGVALVAMSGGDWSYSQAWVLGGIMLWAVAALTAELVLWPGERALQVGVGDLVPPPDLGRRCLAVAASAGGVSALLVAAAVLMVAKP